MSLPDTPVALQVRALCAGLQSELVKGECPRDEDALITCLAAGDLISEEVGRLSRPPQPG